MASLLQLQNGMKAYGSKVLFANASFATGEGEHIGVIGPNGAGKTTLFKVIIGQEHLDAGEITTSNSLRLGYLPQEESWQIADTLENYLQKNCSLPIWELKKIGLNLGLTAEMFASPITSLSGGYRMRGKLLSVIGQEPNLMLLDEPTNYLDLETLLVLEDFLLSYKGAFLLISHDREFLRRTTDHIVEIESGEITKFNGNIDDYFEQKAQLRDLLERQLVNQETKRKQVLDFATRFGAKATKARQVQSKLKLLEKMEIIELRALPVLARIRLPQPPKIGKIVLTCQGISLGYGFNTVLKNVNMILNRGDRIGIVGLNGAGKSTLLKGLASVLKPSSGLLEYSPDISFGYYAQHVSEGLKPQQTVLEAMGEKADKSMTHQDILDLAGALMFSGADVRKQVKILSGGEKSRVALGQILAQRSALLLLDEPTNHLDFHTVEALTQALEKYQGTVVMVSHDRGFISRVASKIIEIREGTADLYPGTYDDYVWSLQKGVLSFRDDGAPCLDRNASLMKEPDIELPKFNYKEEKKKIEKTIRDCERRISNIDAELILTRKRMDELNNELLKSSGGKAVEAAKELGILQGTTDRLEEEWLLLANQRDEWLAKLSHF